MAGNRVASVKVFRPTHVPSELHEVWHGAAEYLARKGRLLKASGKVDYHAINKQYKRSLAAYHAVADEVEAPAARKASVRVQKPAHVPNELLSVWKGAAQHVAKQGKLLTASGKVNYPAINNAYQTVLAGYYNISKAV